MSSSPPVRRVHEPRYVVSDDQVATSVGGETVILGLHDGVYYGLDAVGARVWAMLASPRTVGELVDGIVAEFDVDATRCRTDLAGLLGELEGRGLVRAEP